MKATKTIISTLRDAPNDAVIASHQLMMRSGLIRKLGNGLYSYMPLGYRSFMKVQNIIREELDRAGLLEMKPTVIQPGELWKESGRWETMGPEMLKATTRGGQDMIVSPTAEEAFTALIRDGLDSYKQLPLIPYQINTKYRDEIRPRYGVMRGREFTMMDAYSFDADKESLDNSYNTVAEAYRKIFKRLGLKTISVKADTGNMGGSGSEEFMIESPVGDDTLMLCECGYAANVEKAACRPDIPVDDSGNPQVKTDLPVEEVATPNVFSIEDMEKFFGTTSKRFVKALIYRVINCGLDLSKANGSKNFKQVTEGNFTYYPLSYVCVLIRGDLEVNEAKLAGLLKCSDLCLAEGDEIVQMAGAPHGFVGPRTLNCPIIQDLSVNDMHDAFAGAGKEGFHIKHVEPGRDYTPFMVGDVRTAMVGDACPDCGKPFYSKKGNELGHIFKLGDKYTKAMNVTYLDQSGKPVTPLMGCYGIGVDRTLASIIETYHDDKGIMFPMSTAPYQVAVVPIAYKDKMKEAADRLYEELEKLGIDVLLDDRNERPGVKFNDADLIGFPVRVVIGDKNLPNVEVKMRNQNDPELVPLEEAGKKIAEIVKTELDKLNG